MHLVAALLALVLLAPAAGAAEPKTEEEKTLYALGLALSRSVASFNLTPAEVEMVKAGLAEGLAPKGKQPTVDVEQYMAKIQELQKSRITVTAGKAKQEGQAFLDKAAAEKGTTKLPSGVLYTPTEPGTGESPKATDKVKVHYEGKLIDGTVFDSSKKRGEPATFPLNGVVKCWTEGVQQMKVGGKAKLVCPSDTAYGDRGSPPAIPPGATLVFDVELLEIVK
jgi:FKBP-type peptidyl-prolyl cis-trans isomerase